MPDITMCLNDECPSHRKCYRFAAEPDERYQSYAEFAPKEGEEKCVNFYERRSKHE